MTAIRIGSEYLDLSADTRIALERNSSILQPADERGEVSLAIRLTRTEPNDRRLGWPSRFDQRRGLPLVIEDVALLDENNGLVAEGILRYRGIEPTAFLYNLEFGASAVMTRLKSRSIRAFLYGGPRAARPPVPDPVNPDDPQIALAQHMNHVVDHNELYDVVFAPFSNNDSSGQWKAYTDWIDALNESSPTNPPREYTPHVNFNYWSGPLSSNPGGCGFTYTSDVCPIPKLAYVLKAIFRELRIPFETDLFDDAELATLVIVPTGGNLVTQVQTRPNATPLLRNYYNIGEHLPDVTPAELIRALMDTFGLHFDVTPTGTARLLRTAPAIMLNEAANLTRYASPAYTVEVQDEQRIVAKHRPADNDQLYKDNNEQPDPKQVTEPVATVADLQASPTQPDLYTLVTDKGRYYRTETITTDPSTDPPTTEIQWRPSAYYLPDYPLGSGQSEQDHTIGTVPTFTERMEYLFGNGSYQIPTLCFLEKHKSEEYATAISQTIRLAWYRGKVYVDGAKDMSNRPAYVPFLTQGNYSGDGVRLGNYTLSVDGPDGLVNRFLKPLLALKIPRLVAKYPAALDALQYGALDFSRMISIRGDEFMMRRATLTLPLSAPAQIEVVPRRDIEALVGNMQVLMEPVIVPGPVPPRVPGPGDTLLFNDVNLVYINALNTQTVTTTTAGTVDVRQMGTGSVMWLYKFTGTRIKVHYVRGYAAHTAEVIIDGDTDNVHVLNATLPNQTPSSSGPWPVGVWTSPDLADPTAEHYFNLYCTQSFFYIWKVTIE